MGDADLEKHFEGQADTPAEPEQQTQSQEVETEATKEPPVTIESLQEQLKGLQDRYEKQIKSNQDKEKFIQRQSNELGQLRSLRERLEARKAELAAQDPAKQFIENPQQFRDSTIEAARIEQEIARVEQAEVQAARQEETRAVMERNFSFLQSNVPDLPDLMPQMVEYLKEQGKDDPQAIAAFQQNPFQFPAHNILAIAHAVRANAELKALKAQMEEIKQKPQALLDKIDSAARNKPLANASGGTATQTGAKGVGDMTDLQIRNMSSRELDELLSTLK